MKTHINSSVAFVGVSPADISGGIFNAANLLQGNYLACFVLQGLQAATPSILSGLVGALGIANALTLITNAISPAVSSMSCPTMSTISMTVRIRKAVFLYFILTIFPPCLIILEKSVRSFYATIIMAIANFLAF